MSRTRLSTKGQIVVPRDICKRHGWEPGTDLEVEDQGKCVMIRLATRRSPASLDDLLGCLPYAGSAKSLEEMEEGIAEGARSRS